MQECDHGPESGSGKRMALPLHALQGDVHRLRARCDGAEFAQRIVLVLAQPKLPRSGRAGGHSGNLQGWPGVFRGAVTPPLVAMTSPGFWLRAGGPPRYNFTIQDAAAAESFPVGRRSQAEERGAKPRVKAALPLHHRHSHREPTGELPMKKSRAIAVALFLLLGTAITASA